MVLVTFSRWRRDFVQYITGQLSQFWNRLPPSLRQILTHSGKALFNFREYGARQAAAITITPYSPPFP